MNEDKKRFLFWFKILLTIAALTLLVIYFPVVVGFLKECLSICMPFIAGGIIAFILNIPMRAIEEALFKKAKSKFLLKIKRPVSIVLTIVFVILLVSILSMAVIPQVIDTAKTLPAKITYFYQNILRNLDKLMKENPEIAEKAMTEFEKLKEIKIDWELVLTNIKDFFFNGVGGSFVINTFSFAGKVGGGIVSAVISVIFSVYILAQKEKLGKQVKRIAAAVFPEKQFYLIMKITYLLNDNFSKFIAGQCVEAVILGALTMIAMAIFRFKYIVLIGVLVSFTALIPVVGGFIGSAVGAFLFLLDDPIKALWFLVLFIVVQQIEGNLIYPYVVGNSVGLPSMWVLAAITVGGSLMGIGGMLFFIPLTSTIYTLIRDYTNERNKQKEWTTHAISRAPESFVSVEEQRRRRGGVFGNLIAKFKSKSGSESETQTNKNSVNRSVRHNKRNRRGKR